MRKNAFLKRREVQAAKPKARQLVWRRAYYCTGLGSFRTSVGAVDTRVRSADTRLRNADTRLRAVDTRLRNADAGLWNAAQELGALTRELGTLTRGLGALTQGLGTLAQGLATVARPCPNRPRYEPGLLRLVRVAPDGVHQFIEQFPILHQHLFKAAFQYEAVLFEHALRP